MLDQMNRWIHSGQGFTLDHIDFNYRSDLPAVGEKQLTAVLLDMSKAFDSFHHRSGSKAMKSLPSPQSLFPLKIPLG